MHTIGITGGVGAGKSFVLDYIESHYKVKIYKADDIANQIKLPGEICYEPLVEIFGKDVLDDQGFISKSKMAELVFKDKSLLEKVNGIIHPAVKVFIKQEIEKESKKGEIDFFILEAALLIEDGYDKILDELWYIYASKEIRRARLKASRNYTDEKIDNIMNNQLSEEEFKKYCLVTIENNGNEEKTFLQIDTVLGAYLNEKR